jgi:hypothetical protein
VSHLEQYREYRTVAQELNKPILSACADHDVLMESAQLLGIERQGTDLLYEVEEEMPVHYDFLLHEYQQEGKTPIERYYEQEQWDTDTEQVVLEALCQAYTSLFEVSAIDETEDRLILSDLLDDNEEATVTDVSLSGSAEPGVLLFFRLVPYDAFNMGSGIWFPFAAEKKAQLLNEYEQWDGPTEYQTPAMRRFVAFFDLYREHGIHMQYV